MHFSNKSFKIIIELNVYLDSESPIEIQMRRLSILAVASKHKFYVKYYIISWGAIIYFPVFMKKFKYFN